MRGAARRVRRGRTLAGARGAKRLGDSNAGGAKLKGFSVRSCAEIGRRALGLMASL
jgi:hypothetical protein